MNELRQVPGQLEIQIGGGGSSQNGISDLPRALRDSHTNARQGAHLRQAQAPPRARAHADMQEQDNEEDDDGGDDDNDNGQEPDHMQSYEIYDLDPPESHAQQQQQQHHQHHQQEPQRAQPQQLQAQSDALRQANAADLVVLPQRSNRNGNASVPRQARGNGSRVMPAGYSQPQDMFQQLMHAYELKFPEVSTKWYLEILSMLMFMAAFEITFTGCALKGVSLAYCVAILVAQEVFKFVRLFIRYYFGCFYNRGDRNNENGLRDSAQISTKALKVLTFMMLEKVLNIIFGALLIALIQGKSHFSYFWLTVPLFLNVGVRYTIYRHSSLVNSCISFTDLVLIAYRAYLFVQFMMISLLKERVVTWGWGEAFWAYWVFFAVLVGLDFSLLLLVLSKACMAFSHRVPSYEMHGVIMWFSAFAGHTVIATTCVLAFTDLQNNRPTNKMRTAFVMSIVINTVLLAGAVALGKSLIQFLRLVVLDGIEEDEEAVSQHSLRGGSRQNNVLGSNGGLQSGQELMTHQNNSASQSLNRSRNNRRDGAPSAENAVEDLQSIIASVPRYLQKQSATYFKSFQRPKKARNDSIGGNAQNGDARNTNNNLNQNHNQNAQQTGIGTEGTHQRGGGGGADLQSSVNQLDTIAAAASSPQQALSPNGRGRRRQQQKEALPKWRSFSSDQDKFMMGQGTNLESRKMQQLAAVMAQQMKAGGASNEILISENAPPAGDYASPALPPPGIAQKSASRAIDLQNGGGGNIPPDVALHEDECEDKFPNARSTSRQRRAQGAPANAGGAAAAGTAMASDPKIATLDDLHGISPYARSNGAALGVNTLDTLADIQPDQFPAARRAANDKLNQLEYGSTSSAVRDNRKRVKSSHLENMMLRRKGDSFFIASNANDQQQQQSQQQPGSELAGAMSPNGKESHRKSNKGADGARAENESASVRDQTNANCLICFDRQANSVFMNCGHGGVCYECGLDLWRNTNECFLCRQPIHHLLEVELIEGERNVFKVLSTTQVVIQNHEGELGSPNAQNALSEGDEEVVYEDSQHDEDEQDGERH